MNGLEIPNERPDDESSGSRLGKPPGKASIHPVLMKKLSDEERALFESMSIIEGNDKWQNHSILLIDARLASLERQQKSGETWRTVFASKWSVLTWIGGVLFSVFSLELLRWLLKLKGP